MTSADASTADTAPAEDNSGKRRRGLLIVALVAAVLGLIWFSWWWLHARWFVSTEDAYVSGTVVQITAEVGGTVRTVHPRETEAVAAGEPLLELDPADAR